MRRMVLRNLLLTSVLGTPVVLAQSLLTARTAIQTTDGHQLLVTVISKGAATRGSADAWWTWGDTSDSTYLFALDRPDNVRFALVFTSPKSGRQATLIYARKAQDPLPVRQSGTATTLGDVSAYPHLVITTPASDWAVNGQASYRLKLVGDGVAGQENVTSTPDGIPDVLRLVTPGADGLPLRDETTVTQNPFPNRGYSRYGLQQRAAPGGVFQTWPALMPTFPYLGAGQRRPDWFSSNPNPFYFNVGSGELQFFPFTGFQTAGMYGINSLTVDKKDFENAFVLYPLRSGPGSSYADLVIRSKSFPAGDRFGPSPSTLARTTFRYSWKTEDPQLWTYSLGLAGPNAVIGAATDQVAIEASYRALPALVSGAAWPAVSFVQAMNGYTGSEGIYHYSVQDDRVWQAFQPNPPRTFVLGSPLFQADTRLGPDAEHALPLSFRGEYLFGAARKVSLYRSELDGLVHLKGAQEGFWSVRPGQYLYFSDLNQDGIMDSIQECRTPDAAVPGSTTPPAAEAPARRVCDAQLVRLGHSAVLVADGKVSVKRGLNPSAASAVTVPTSAASWASFVSQSARGRPVESTVAGFWAALPGTETVVSSRPAASVALDSKTHRLTVMLRPVARQATRVVVADDGTAAVK